MESICVSGEPDSIKKSCYDCYFLTSALSWWCTNKKAIEYRGTSFPGVCNCHFWKPIRKKEDLSWFEKIKFFFLVNWVYWPTHCEGKQPPK
jgi:hypothetical protein